jgi:hypothetical protein
VLEEFAFDRRRTCCSVTDHGCAEALAGRHTEDARHGFALVARLADRWGVQPTRQGTRVWFETAHSRSGRPAGIRDERKTGDEQKTAIRAAAR